MYMEKAFFLQETRHFNKFINYSTRKNYKNRRKKVKETKIQLNGENN